MRSSTRSNSRCSAEESYKGKEIGTVTIFLGDLRISTNVKREDGSRAVGTQLSNSVCDAVLGAGRDLGRPGVRGQRLVHHGLRADPRPGGEDHRRALRGSSASSVSCINSGSSAPCSWRSSAARPWPAWYCCCWSSERVLRPDSLRGEDGPEGDRRRHDGAGGHSAAGRDGRALPGRGQHGPGGRRARRAVSSRPRSSRSAAANSWPPWVDWRRAWPTKSTIP